MAMCTVCNGIGCPCCWEEPKTMDCPEKVYENKKALFTKGFSFRYQLNYNYEKSKLSEKSAKFVQNKNK